MKKILITGVAGFLGGRVAKFFASNPQYSVLTTSRRLDRKDEMIYSGCQFVDGDLSDKAFCRHITGDIDIVIHCAALSTPFGQYKNFYTSNFEATKYLLDASMENGVKKFIFISTPSIYFNFSDRFNVKESEPLPKKMVNAYADTKRMAEEYVLSKNNQGIQTIALRPRAIIGAEDTVIFPRVLEAYKSGRLKIIGDGQNICDLTCAQNVIEAIGCAIAAPDAAYGEAFNITDGASVNFWDAVNFALTSLGYHRVEKKIPKTIALLAAALIEKKALWFHPQKEPSLTQYGVGILCLNFTLSIQKAQELLKYQPKMTTMEGIEEYILWHKKNH